MVYFRTDGNSKSGSGHLIRCMALGYMLKYEFDIKFICKEIPGKIKKELIENTFQIKTIVKESIFFDLLQPEDIVVLDGYHFVTEYQKQIKAKGCKLVCIDDLHDKKFYADLIINHAPGVKPEDYKAQSYTQFALGLEYALLRPAFLKQALKPRNIKKIEILLICFGGSDFKNLTQSTLKVVLEFTKFIKIIVVTGTTYQISEGFIQLIKSDPRIEHRHALNENQMLGAMMEADLVIVPASGILFEALASRCRLISGIYADNQKFVYTNFSLMKLIIGASDFNSIDIRKAINNALKSTSKAKNVIDGNSSKRIKSYFYELSSHLRKANINDCELLFKWANDRDVRINAITKDPIVWENHLKWFNTKITSDKTRMFILEIDGNPFGQIRYDLQDNEWVVDYSISTEMRGKGLGKVILKMSLPYFNGQIIKAFVHEKNIPSQLVFKLLGFSQTEIVEFNSEFYIEFKMTA